MLRLSLLLVAIVGLNSTNCQDEDYKQVGLTQHNFYRAKHGGPPMQLDSAVQASAQKWADYLASSGQFKHSGGKYGENIYMAGGGRGSLSDTVNSAVTSWYNEIKNYNFNNPGFGMNTGHFTQVVWKASTHLGIGAAKGSNGNVVVVGQYSPAGNMMGGDNFRKNVVPPQN